MPFAMPFADRTKALLEQTAVPFALMPLHVPAFIRSAVNDALDRGETHYTDRPGILPLRQKIAASLEDRFQIPVKPKGDIIVTCGVTEARFVAIQQLLKPGEKIAAPASSDRIIGAALLRRVATQNEIAGNAALIYLTSSTTETELRSSLVQTPATALVLFEVDERDSHFHPSQVPGFGDRTVTIGGLGDASWQIGYLASPGSFSSALRDFKQALTICSTSISQWAALAFEEES